MKKINLNGKNGESHKELVLQILILPSHIPGSPGFSVEDIFKSVKINEKIQALEGGGLLLEDAEYQWLNAHVSNFRYGQATRKIMDMIEAVQNAEDVNIKESKEGE